MLSLFGLIWIFHFLAWIAFRASFFFLEIKYCFDLVHYVLNHQMSLKYVIFKFTVYILKCHTDFVTVLFRPIEGNAKPFLFLKLPDACMHGQWNNCFVLSMAKTFCILIYQVYNEKKFDSWCHVSINFFLLECW